MAPDFSRRHFLEIAGGAGAFATLRGRRGRRRRARPRAALAGRRAHRVVRSSHALGAARARRKRSGPLRPGFWLDYFRRVRGDAACLSAGGIVAFYPTEVPLHHRSAWLGEANPFGTLVAGCRALGMHVVARVDPHAAREEVRAAHPDWIAVTRSGEP